MATAVATHDQCDFSRRCPFHCRIILQRIVYNPLASPDILGVSSGATFAIIITGVMVGSVLAAFNWGVAFLGSLTVLMLLLIIGKRSHFNPSNFVLSVLPLAPYYKLSCSLRWRKALGKVTKFCSGSRAQRIASPVLVH